MSTYLIFLGPPGSGKGTQADVLHDKFGWVHLSSGDLFRENISRGTPLGLKVKDILASGALVPDDLTIAMVMDRLQSPDTGEGVIFDGFPRTVAQAEALQRALSEAGKKIDAAIYFSIPDQVIVDRLAARRVCPRCGTVYNLISKPPKDDERCDNDGEKLVQRPDDRPEVVQKRLDVYRDQTTPVIDYYQTQGLLREVDASRAIDQVQIELESLTEVIVSNANRAQIAD